MMGLLAGNYNDREFEKLLFIQDISKVRGILGQLIYEYVTTPA